MRQPLIDQNLRYEPFDRTPDMILLIMKSYKRVVYPSEKMDCLYFAVTDTRWDTR